MVGKSIVKRTYESKDHIFDMNGHYSDLSFVDPAWEHLNTFSSTSSWIGESQGKARLQFVDPAVIAPTFLHTDTTDAAANHKSNLECPTLSRTSGAPNGALWSRCGGNFSWYFLAQGVIRNIPMGFPQWTENALLINCWEGPRWSEMDCEYHFIPTALFASMRWTFSKSAKNDWIQDRKGRGQSASSIQQWME